ncbi:MAG: hypothetical protein J6Y94_01905, partial [Bacteriovoracaceae bacterium]|nr:hypothetical protein [Bacteriovoracaceae bacterium]
RKGAATLELIIPSLICRNEKQRLIVDIPGSTKGKDFHIQLRPQIITGEDGTPRLSLGVQANLAQANPEVNKALDLGWLGDVFDALPHWPADFVVRQAGKRYIFDPLNESAQEMATQLPLVDLTKVTYGPAALIISGKAKTNLAANYTIYQSISRKLAQEE